jgi:hypothetical protein
MSGTGTGTVSNAHYFEIFLKCSSYRTVCRQGLYCAIDLCHKLTELQLFLLKSGFTHFLAPVIKVSPET